MDYWERIELELILVIALTLLALVLSILIGNKIYSTIAMTMLLGEYLLARYFEKLEKEYKWKR